MKRLVVVGVGLLLAPLAWSSGALEAHEDGTFARSVVDTWASLFPEEPVEPERDLSGLAMVPREHQLGIGRVVTLRELDARVSDPVFERRIRQQAANTLLRERMKPFRSDRLVEKIRELEERERLRSEGRASDAPRIDCPTIVTGQLVGDAGTAGGTD